MNSLFAAEMTLTLTRSRLPTKSVQIHSTLHLEQLQEITTPGSLDSISGNFPLTTQLRLSSRERIVPEEHYFCSGLQAKLSSGIPAQFLAVLPSGNLDWRSFLKCSLSDYFKYTICGSYHIFVPTQNPRVTMARGYIPPCTSRSSIPAFRPSPISPGFGVQSATSFPAGYTQEWR